MKLSPLDGDRWKDHNLGSDNPDMRKSRRDLYLERMFETHSEAWERVGLAVDVSQRAVRRARREAAVLLPLLVAVLVVFDNRQQFLGVRPNTPGDTVTRI